MNISEYDFHLNVKDYNPNINREIVYIRIEPGELKDTLLSIIVSLKDLSWLSIFDNETIRKSFESRALKTIEELETLFKTEKEDNPLIEDVGEYIVSALSLQALGTIETYKAVPLMELLGRKKKNNPGFDFYSEDTSDSLVICGEAKYVKDGYGYNRSFEQINDFIDENKHIDDAPLIEKFVSPSALDKLGKNEVGVCCAFSTTEEHKDVIVRKIANNKHFIEAVKRYESILVVAVNI